jgi:hypothetical protein
MKTRFAFALALATSLPFTACREPEPVSPVVGLTEPIDAPKFPVLDNYPEREITVHLYVTSSVRHFCRVDIHDGHVMRRREVCNLTQALQRERRSGPRVGRLAG